MSAETCQAQCCPCRHADEITVLRLIAAGLVEWNDGEGDNCRGGRHAWNGLFDLLTVARKALEQKP